MLDAVAALPVRVLLTLGESAGQRRRSAAERDSCGFVPHDLVLPRMAAVISHGGLSTITAALTAGVPSSASRKDAISPTTPNASRRPASDVPSSCHPRPRSGVRSGNCWHTRQHCGEACRFADVIAALGGGGTATRQVAHLARARMYR